MSVQRYTGWEMFPVKESHRSDGHVYVKASDYDELKRLYDDALEKYIELRRKRNGHSASPPQPGAVE